MGRLYIGPEMIDVTKLIKDNKTLIGYRDKTLIIQIDNINWKDTDIYWEDIELEQYIPPQDINIAGLELENKQLKIRLESLEMAMLKLMDNIQGGK